MRIVLVGAMLMLALGSETRAASLDALISDFQLIGLGNKKPPVTVALPTVGGQTVALRDLAGRVVLLYFWATW